MFSLCPCLLCAESWAGDGLDCDGEMDCSLLLLKGKPATSILLAAGAMHADAEVIVSSGWLTRLHSF